MNKSRFRFVYSLSVLACALPLALSTSSLSKGNAEGLFDYSDGTHLAILKAGDLLSKSRIELDQSEVNYLNETSTKSLTYSESFLEDDVKTSRIGDKEYVFAHESTYLDSNGRAWTWIPLTVEAETNVSFVNYDGLYVAEFDTATGLEKAKVNYQLELDVSSQVFNSFINDSYEAALSIDNTYEQYLDDLAYYNRRPTSELEYDTQLAEYNKYLEDYQSYLNKKENYETYLVNKAKYEEDLAKYNEYLQAKAQYEIDVANYKQNQEDWAYYLANHEQNLKEYEEFGVKYENSRYQLSAMQAAYEQDTEHSSSLAQYLLSNTVASVLARKDELSVLGVPTDLVDAADAATVKLRTCFREYNELTTDEARYSYYYINYNYIKSNTNVLLRSLERLGRYDSVKNVAKDRGKLPQFYTVLFQLIYFANAVCDTPVYNYEAFNPVTGKGDMSKPGAQILDENFQIEGSTYLTWLKGYDFIDTSKTATPSSGILPTKQVILIPEPPTLPVPVEPTIVQKPIAPVEVSEPTAPKEVLEPIPYDPSAVEPDYPSILEGEIYSDLLDAYRADKVHEKEPLTQSVKISINGSREVNLNQDKVAIFRDYQDNPSHFVFFNGTGVNYEFEVPYKPGDEYFVEYFFDYWSDNSGNAVDLRTISESMNLYPVFDTGDRQRYEITWVYPDETLTINVTSGSIPSAPKAPKKEETDEHYYVFDCWSPSLEEVDSTETYTAVFKEYDIFDITYEIDGNLIHKKEKENYDPNAPKTFELEDGTTYVINSWMEEGETLPGLHIVTKETTYHASFDKYYTITWNILGEISKEKYLAGETVTYKGNIPDPIRGEQYYSVFTFDQALGTATSNRTIKATYVNHAYPEILLKIDGQTIILTGQYLPGEEIDKPSTYSNGFYHYDITGWTKSGTSYIASYTKTPYIGGGIYYNYVGETLKVDAALSHLNEVDLSYLLTMMGQGDLNVCPLRLMFNDGEVNLTSTQVKYLIMRHAKTVGIEFLDLSNRHYSIEIVVKDENGNDVLIPDFYPEVTINKNVDYLHSQVYLNDEEVNASLSYGCVQFRAQINLAYEVIPAYSVSISASSSVYVRLSKKGGQVGDSVHIEYTVQKGYKLEYMIARTRGGNAVVIDAQNNFVMPADDVIINFVCTRLQYSLELYVDDALYASYRVNYGDTITLPTYIKKVGDETYEYLFTGWGINADSISVTNDTVLRAEFIKVEREQKSERKTSKAVEIAGYVAVGALSVGLAVGLFFIFRKIIKH